MKAFQKSIGIVFIATISSACVPIEGDGTKNSFLDGILPNVSFSHLEVKALTLSMWKVTSFSLSTIQILLVSLLTILIIIWPLKRSIGQMVTMPMVFKFYRMTKVWWLCPWKLSGQNYLIWSKHFEGRTI